MVVSGYVCVSVCPRPSALTIEPRNLIFLHEHLYWEQVKTVFSIFFHFFTELCPFFDCPLFILCNFDAVLWKIGKWLNYQTRLSVCLFVCPLSRPLTIRPRNLIFCISTRIGNSKKLFQFICFIELCPFFDFHYNLNGWVWESQRGEESDFWHTVPLFEVENVHNFLFVKKGHLLELWDL